MGRFYSAFLCAYDDIDLIIGHVVVFALIWFYMICHAHSFPLCFITTTDIIRILVNRIIDKHTNTRHEPKETTDLRLN